MKVCVLGGGSWGTALAIHLAKKSYDISIWEFFDEQAKQMQNERFCRLMPDVTLPENIVVSSDMGEMIKGSEIILVVVPSNTFESTLNKAKEFITNQKIIICSKGFASNQKFLSHAASEILPDNQIYCLYGPTIAIDVAKGNLTGIVLSGENEVEDLKKILESENLKVETTSDIIGVQVGSALKNVVTIFVGIAEGMGSGENTKAYIFTKGLEEIVTLGTALGAKQETFYGLTCMGDLTLNSRNRNLGIQLGQGKDLEEILRDQLHVSEGVIAVENAVKLSEKLNIHLPVISGLKNILFNKVIPTEVLNSLP